MLFCCYMTDLKDVWTRLKTFFTVHALEVREKKTQCFQADVKRYKCSYLKMGQLHQSRIKTTEERKNSEAKNEIRNVERKEISRLSKMNVYVVEERKCKLIFYSRWVTKRGTVENTKFEQQQKRKRKKHFLTYLFSWITGGWVIFFY